MSHLVLVGLMGSGKTAVGEASAARLGRRFVDTDRLVEAAAGMTVADVFAAEGEAGFRDRERAAVADACASPEPVVIGCGGGAPLEAANRRALRAAGFVVWLRAEPEVLAARVAGEVRVRPLLAGAPTIATLERLAARREDAYAATAHTSVVTDDRTVAEVVAAVLAAYGEAGR